MTGITGRIIETMSQAECEIAEDIDRAEAAEAEVARLRDENAEAWHAFDRQQSRGDRLAARVAELEAQIAAQGWRPVTEEPDADAMYPVRVQYRGQVYLDREMRNWNRASGWNDMFAQSKVVEWYPLPPAPQETE